VIGGLHPPTVRTIKWKYESAGSKAIKNAFTGSESSS